MLAEERAAAKTENREPHPATVAKFDADHPGRPTPTDLAPANAVTTAAKIKRAYSTGERATSEKV